MLFLYVDLQHVFRFLDNFEILDLIVIYFLKIKILSFRDQNRKISTKN